MYCGIAQLYPTLQQATNWLVKYCVTCNYVSPHDPLNIAIHKWIQSYYISPWNIASKYCITYISHMDEGIATWTLHYIYHHTLRMMRGSNPSHPFFLHSPYKNEAFVIFKIYRVRNDLQQSILLGFQSMFPVLHIYEHLQTFIYWKQIVCLWRYDLSNGWLN